MHNLSCENEFYLHENEKSALNLDRFGTEAWGNSEMALFFVYKYYSPELRF